MRLVHRWYLRAALVVPRLAFFHSLSHLRLDLRTSSTASDGGQKHSIKRSKILRISVITDNRCFANASEPNDQSIPTKRPRMDKMITMINVLLKNMRYNKIVTVTAIRVNEPSLNINKPILLHIGRNRTHNDESYCSAGRK